MKVWLLGAGFSRPLGGPLLGDLLSVHSLETLRRRHPGSWLAQSEYEILVHTCASGIADGLWSDPESFLARLLPRDDADETIVKTAHAKACATLSAPISFDHYESLYCQAIALVAAQCCDFVDRARQERESWLPYERWARAVTTDDVVVTFNYDTVVEHAFRRVGRSLYVPNQRFGHNARARTGHPILLKLHGSSDFRDTIPHPYEPPTIANLERNPAFIGIPGAGKTDHAEYDFDEVWTRAEEALRSANALSIVGYRCPTSDEMAKAWLLDGLAANEKRPSVDVVLGPGGHADVQRLLSLLHAIGIAANDRACWAQDYLSTVGVGQGWRPGHTPADDDV